MNEYLPLLRGLVCLLFPIAMGLLIAVIILSRWMQSETQTGKQLLPPLRNLIVFSPSRLTGDGLLARRWLIRCLIAL
jgi:hypothetical protein